MFKKFPIWKFTGDGNSPVSPLLRVTFNQSLPHNQDYSLIRIDIRSTVTPVDVAAACKVLFRITAALALARRS